MDEYIKRSEALEITTRTCGDYAAAWSEIRKLPAADVAEVVHGRWIKDDFLSDDVNNAEKCSQCGELIGWFGNLPNYCPHCGAKMDGGDNDAGN